MSTLIPLFSSPVFVSSITDVDFVNIAKIASNAQYEDLDQDINISGEEYLIDRLPDLKRSIIKNVNEYFYNLLEIDPSFNYYFPDSWFVRVKPGAYTKKGIHFHTNSLFSGVVYIDVDSDSGGLELCKGSPASYYSVTYKIPFKNINYLSAQDWIIPPAVGKIVIFPSYLLHSVLKNNTSKNRYSFAFNILPDNYRNNFVTTRIIDR